MNRNGASDQRTDRRVRVTGRHDRRMQPTVTVLEDRRLLSRFTVNSTLDDGSAGTLRWAVGQADSIAGANTIDFDSTVFNTPKAITLTGSQLELSNTGGTETITGPVAGVTVSGGGLSRVFLVDGGVSASISGLTLAGGSTSGEGGGLFNSAGATAAITDCNFSGNSAVSNGGGLYNGGTATLINCLFNGNLARLGGGLDSIAGDTTLSNTVVSGNVATSGGGGFAIVNSSTDLSNCTFSDNSAANGAGGLFIYGGATTLTDCTVSGNTAANGAGGGVDQNVGTTILNNCTLSGNSASFGGGGLFDGRGTTMLTDCTLSGNSTGGYGGGVDTTFYGTATLANCTVSGNSASAGGGFSVGLSSATTLTNCIISGNSAATNGGGSSGGVYSTSTLTNCTISGNSASMNGGGLFNKSYYGASLTNCTISGNSAAANGGGLFNNSYYATTLINCTVSGNVASSGGGLDNGSGTVNTGNIIVAENSATVSAPDALGIFASLGNNLIGETDGSGGWVGSDLTGTIDQPLDPLLAASGNYGGPTQTMPLLPGSPAIDAGSNVLIPAGATTDQRGLARIVNSVVDIGAFESSGFTIAVTTGTGQSTGVLTAFSGPLVVAVAPKNPVEPTAGGLVRFTFPPIGASAMPIASPATINATDTASIAAAADGIVGVYTVTATASGIAGRASFRLTNTPLIVVLDPSAAGALRLSGNASIKTSGVVYVDSSSSSALSASGNARVKAAAIDVHGGVQQIGNASLSPNPTTGVAALAVVSLPSPSVLGMTNYGSIKLSGNSITTIQPGIYSKISVSGNARLTLSSGIYLIEGGGLSVSGGANIIGSGVMIVSSGSNYPDPGGMYGSVLLSSTGKCSLSPATSGTYAGIVFFQPLDNTKSISVSGNASAMIGTIYAPGAQLSETRNGALQASLIVDTLTINGNGSVGAASRPIITIVTSQTADREISDLGLIPDLFDGTGDESTTRAFLVRAASKR